MMKKTTGGDLVAGNNHVDKVRQALIDLDLDNIAGLVKEAIDSGASRQDIIEKGMRDGMSEVGRRFEEGEYYLAELVLAAETMKDGLAAIEAEMPGEAGPTKATVVLATVKGDVHDIGKNLVGATLTAAGYKVVDLGVDVPADELVRAARDNDAAVVGISVLLTPMVSELGNTVRALESAGLRDKVKIIIGGACTSESLASEHSCDAFGKDAVEAVRLVDSLTGN
jgi:methylmalonyl-CoA mutase cobalamin-binding domain/chain